MVLKGLNMDYWLILLCQITAYRITNCHLIVCVCTCVDCHTGQVFLLIWQVANSANAMGLHCCHCQCWHYCLLCPKLLITWLMAVGSYVAYVLANFSH